MQLSPLTETQAGLNTLLGKKVGLFKLWAPKDIELPIYFQHLHLGTLSPSGKPYGIKKSNEPIANQY